MNKRKILKCLIYCFAAVFLVYVFSEYFKFKHMMDNLSVGSGIIQTKQIIGQGQPLKYVAAGDSTAVGVGASGFETSYPFLIAKELAKNHQVSYLNVGVSGATAKDLLNEQMPLIKQAQPDIVTISIGINDLMAMDPSSSVISRIQNIVKELLAETSAKIYLANIMSVKYSQLLPWYYRRNIEAKSSYVNQEVKKMESARVKIINIHDNGSADAKNNKQYFASDDFHPGDFGYRLWAQSFLEKI